MIMTGRESIRAFSSINKGRKKDAEKGYLPGLLKNLIIDIHDLFLQAAYRVTE